MNTAATGDSSDYAARREMMDDFSRALAPFLREQLPASCRPEIGVTDPPAPLAVVCHLGVEDLDQALGVQLVALMEAARKVAFQAFPTLPLVFERLSPPLNRHGFVAHLGDHAPQPVYPRFVYAKARLHMRRGLRPATGEVLAAMKGGRP